jgi:broad specificity phosphatase PhoE
MTTFYLVRHGEPAWHLIHDRNLPGWGNDMVPLTPKGVEQIQCTSEQLRPFSPELVVASVMPRAVHSAALISRALDLPLEVEFDLHEWVPDLTHSWVNGEQVDKAFHECMAGNGEWPDGVECTWEPVSQVRARALSVLERYRQYQRVVVACHFVVVYSLTRKEPEHGEMNLFELN